MALDDRQHVEAVAIIRRLVEVADAEAVLAGKQWLKENHPEPGAYVAAARVAPYREAAARGKRMRRWRRWGSA